MNTTPMNIPMSIAEFAKARNVTERTVNNWLSAARLPGATKIGGKWMIPHDAELAPPAGAAVAQAAAGVVALPSYAAQLAAAADPTPLDELEAAPGFVPLDVAARILGLEVGTLANPVNRDRFHVEKIGGKLRMPQSAIREVFGA